MFELFGPTPDGGNLDTTATADTGGGSPWYQSTIDFVIRAAASNAFAPTQQNQQYIVDAQGRLVPAGSVLLGTQVKATQQNPLIVMGAIAIVGLLLFKLVK